MSHPVWVRGLKQAKILWLVFKHWSHPVWVRGLKLCIPEEVYVVSCRTPCGCVDWNSYQIICVSLDRCRTPCGCVDWNTLSNGNLLLFAVAPRVGAWIETFWTLFNSLFVIVAPRVGAWIETFNYTNKNKARLWSHPVWVRGLKLCLSLDLPIPLGRRTPCGCVDWNWLSII